VAAGLAGRRVESAQGFSTSPNQHQPDERASRPLDGRAPAAAAAAGAAACA
jgi:hypothetical protein